MRPIDADALKKSIKSYADDQYAENEYLGEYAIMNIIDNAPTVEPKLKDDIIEAFNLITDQEFEHSDSFCIVTPKGKKIEFEKKRPQGEWINHRNDYGHNIADCSLCGKTMQWHDEDEDGIPRYCWYCGAPMKNEVRT